MRLLVERDDVEADSKDADGQTQLSRREWAREYVAALFVEKIE